MPAGRMATMNETAVWRLTPEDERSSLGFEVQRLVAATQSLMAANAHHIADGIEHLRLKAIVHELPDFLYVKDRESRFVFANAATARSLGLDSASALVGKTDFDLLPYDAAKAFLAIEREIIATGQPRLD